MPSQATQEAETGRISVSPDQKKKKRKVRI
jgi:hypothetical protein